MCGCGGGGGAGSIGVGGTGSVRSDVWVHIGAHPLGETYAAKVFYPSEDSARRAAEAHGGTYKKFVHA